MYWATLGNLCVESGKTTDAIDAYEHSVRLYPTSVVWERLALACESDHQHSKARDAMHELEKLDPKRASGLKEKLGESLR